MNMQIKPQETNAISTMRVEHVLLSTSDYDATMAWWTDMLGFNIKIEWTVPEFEGVRLAYLEKNGFMIEIVGQAESFQKRSIPNDLPEHLSDNGFSHLAFVVDNVDEVMSELAAKGVEPFFPATSFPDVGRRVAFIKDNQCNFIEFAHDLEE